MSRSYYPPTPKGPPREGDTIIGSDTLPDGSVRVWYDRDGLTFQETYAPTQAPPPTPAQDADHVEPPGPTAQA